MHQIKIFKAIEADVAILEQQVNQWLSESNVRVLNIFGNIAPQSGTTGGSSGSIRQSPFTPSDVLIVVLYEKAT